MELQSSRPRTGPAAHSSPPKPLRIPRKPVPDFRPEPHLDRNTGQAAEERRKDHGRAMLGLHAMNQHIKVPFEHRRESLHDLLKLRLDATHVARVAVHDRDALGVSGVPECLPWGDDAYSNVADKG